MPEQRTSNPLRILAPVALVVFAIVFLVVVSSSGVDDDSTKGGGGALTGQSAADGKKSTGKARPRRRRANYTVKPGDSLGSISEKTGVPIETLEQLNPQIDPQALDAGAKLKLR
jgi:LysM repeat protein